MRYRESCPPRQSLRGIGCGEPEAELALDFKLSTWPRLGGAFVMKRFSAHQLFRCHMCPAGLQKA